LTVATDHEVEAALAGAPGWRREGDELVRELQFRDFAAAMRCAERVAECAVDYGRRPDIRITELNQVRLSVANLHHVGFTPAELRLLAKVNAVVDEPKG
jgi:4a-hydroxytetrahydrobiopterin dehydratase